MKAGMFLRIISICAISVLGAAAAIAAEDFPRRQTLEFFPLGEERCYAQDFAMTPTSPRLARLMLYRLLRPNPRLEYLEDDAEALAARDRENQNTVLVSVIASFNDRDGEFAQSVSCFDHDGRMHCGVDCDGGGFAASPAAKGMSVKLFEQGMVVQGGCGESSPETRMLENRHMAEPSLLLPQPVEVCAAADEHSTLSFARELIPLRQRVSEGMHCLRRAYSAEHLKKNPRQNVTSIAVALALRNEVSDGGTTDVVLDATLSLKLRDGTTARKTVECYPEAYQFGCGDEFRLRRRSADTALLLSGSWDPEEGDPEFTRRMLGLELGKGDDVFRLDASVTGNCEAE